MGVTHVTTEIKNLTGRGRGYRGEFLVDTGAIDCMVPASKLKAAGIKREGKAVYEMADGRPVETFYGFARVSFVGAETVTQVIFGPEDAEPVLGSRGTGKHGHYGRSAHAHAQVTACQAAEASIAANPCRLGEPVQALRIDRLNSRTLQCFN
jgi:predicted aspartyl protease